MTDFLGIAKRSGMFNLGAGKRKETRMFRKTFVVVLLIIVLWLSGCATTSDNVSSPFGPCAMQMDEEYCGP